jgi:TonB family protein
VSSRSTTALLAVVALVAGIQMAGLCGQDPHGHDTQTDISRRTKSKVQPAYPELARKMNLTGTVRVQVVIAPNGAVKDAKVVGGHPVLGNAALDAVRKWRFEPASTESSGVVELKFEGHQ